MAKVFTDADFSPGRIWPGQVRLDDVFALDLDKPFSEQRYEFREDMLLVEFPNGCALHIGWYPSFDPNGEFSVSLAQPRVHEGWKPFLKRSCRSISELRSIVKEMVEVAKGRPSIERDQIPGQL